ncbi:MAG: response regulator transcription factor [Deltaproteobacteria bacterium]|nr:response regulator transcription factor [Deltaproteobacteria bacterium]
MRRVAVISEHILLRQSIAQLLRTQRLDVIEAAHPAALRTSVPKTVLDLDHTSIDGQELLKQLANTTLVVLGSAARLAAASDGVAHIELETPRTTPAALVAAVTRQRSPQPSPELTHAHHQWAAVTPRQRDVLRWLAIGLDNRAIAVEMHVTARAVKAHVSALLAHFALETRTDLALLAESAGVRPLQSRR